MVRSKFLSTIGWLPNTKLQLIIRLLCFILLGSMGMSVRSECLPITSWSFKDATALGGDPFGYMVTDNTPRLQLLNGINTTAPVTWFTSPAIHPDGHWSALVTIASYPSEANAAADFNDASRFAAFAENAKARFLVKETNRWLLGTFRTNAQKELYNIRGYALYQGNIIEVSGGTAPGNETEANVGADIFLDLVLKAQALINSKCGIVADNRSPAIRFFNLRSAPFVDGAVDDSIVTWGIVFEDKDRIQDIDFATLKIEKKIIDQDYEDISGTFMVKFLELLNNGKVTMEPTDTDLTVTFNTSYQELRELIFEADGLHYAYDYAYDMRFTVSDTKGSSGTATAPFWLGRSPNITFIPSTRFDEEVYVLAFYDYDKAADIRWDTLRMTLDGIDFTGLFLDQVSKYMLTSSIKLEPNAQGLDAVFYFSSKEQLCMFFFNASGQLAFHITDHHGYSDIQEQTLDCK